MRYRPIKTFGGVMGMYKHLGKKYVRNFFRPNFPKWRVTVFKDDECISLLETRKEETVWAEVHAFFDDKFPGADRGFLYYDDGNKRVFGFAFTR